MCHLCTDRNLYLGKYLLLVFYLCMVLILCKYELFQMEVVPPEWFCPPYYLQQRGYKRQIVDVGVSVCKRLNAIFNQVSPVEINT